jgi:hypothetical protein
MTIDDPGSTPGDPMTTLDPGSGPADPVIAGEAEVCAWADGPDGEAGDSPDGATAPAGPAPSGMSWEGAFEG